MRVAKAVVNLIEAFERLPGIGPKTAARLTYYLLHVPQEELEKFAGALTHLKKDTKECSVCHNIAETDPCEICLDRGREKNVICVVEQPLDVVAMERGNRYKGVYHVLHGVIDPMHNIGPEEIKIGELIQRLSDKEIREVILALNPNMEGEATCLYINRQIRNLNAEVPKVTRLAHGLPVGADIEYADEVTLTRALEGRRDY
ncbi:MAG: Recombination protein RecR [Candidatus Amesbacteria bacterium GW2011_GWA1_47_16]|uniref:Recombination protein RecR n=5 Tax=Candidatus Amesiibacteriota TaxID=1752730 RepID=A0A1F4ZSI7_9BACT|nr:MAG: Recombination protein RecR [Candidatus Amesbacteria bacterium GW2011_GWC1_47_15]KKU64624.1 MAG: Recombination protein RecR [Candidatus Amesbacteria bacterium GW2011_GWA1_47_16]KKU97888.1 MAG: Recombination protein RecR [Candidatus Amesbacteria bacterium GW2011_GWB1_48_13]OGC99463.1 MAG: recombination protein RecR [Candidatus Amesbacteria bacterium RIFCSPHIGHO2_01_FULL_47_34]OGD00116.1 MAG: recombination protein RecR [Candidatus Amesbacteria bacterium RIFCSPLOWO2_01_FULL_47_33]OGD09088.